MRNAKQTKSLTTTLGNITLLLIASLLAIPSHVALAQGPPQLGTAQNFAVLGGSAVTNTGPTVIIGDLGVSPGTSITGFPPGTVVGATHATDAVAAQAQADNTTAYNVLASEACNTTYGVPTDIGGLTLVPGVYCFSSSAQLTGALTLNANGNPNAAWVFEVGSTLTSASNASVLLINGASPCNVAWQVGSSATIGTGTNFVGDILALASITLNTNATLSGRALAQTGAVTMDSNNVAIPACAVTTATPTINKSFSPASITAGGISTLTITLSNASSTDASITAPLTDTLPSGVTVSGNATNSCGGSVTAAAGGSTVTLVGGTIPANGSCTLTADVTASTAGAYINSLAAGSLQTSNGNNSAPAVSTLTVTGVGLAPTVSKSFSPASITASGISTLTITLANANPTAATLAVPFTDTFPSGMVLSGAASTTCGGTLSGNTGGTAITLTGGSIPANGSCTVNAPVTASTAGSYFNSLAAGSLQTSNGSNTAPAVATLTVSPPPVVPPTLSKSFSPSTIATGGVATLTITLNNANSTVAIMTAPLIDTLPGGMKIAAGGQSTTCGGTVTAILGGSTVTLTGGSIPANGSCTVTTHVAENVCICMGGTNTLPVGALVTSNGSNTTAASATLSVTVVPIAPKLSKSFFPNTIKEGGVSTLTIVLSNPNSTVANLTAPFVDTFPAGLLVYGNASTTCGGTLTAIPGSSQVTLTGGSIPANGSCRVNVSVTENNFLGTVTNTLPVGALHTSNGNNTVAVSAKLTFSITGISAPRLAKYFTPNTIKEGGVSTLTIVLSNPNSTVAHLTAPFVDTFPAGLLVYGNANTTCGGTLTAIPGSSQVTLTGGSIPANGSCRVNVNVTENNFLGTVTNTLPAGALITSNGNNTVPVSATLTFSITGDSPPTLKKSFAPAAIQNGQISTLRITLTNPNSTVAVLTAPLVDTFPSGVFVVGNANNTCGGTVTAIPNSSTVTLTGGSIPINGSCVVTVNVTTLNCYGGRENILPVGALMTSNGNNTVAATATLTAQ